ncbi:hypothetical protein E4U50_005194 [Claviceps purpurea]|nr:hypothetical protein E4U50_005194 [Claviceps purpurea]
MVAYAPLIFLLKLGGELPDDRTSVRALRLQMVRQAATITGSFAARLLTGHADEFLHIEYGNRAGLWAFRAFEPVSGGRGRFGLGGQVLLTVMLITLISTEDSGRQDAREAVVRHLAILRIEV